MFLGRSQCDLGTGALCWVAGDTGSAPLGKEELGARSLGLQVVKMGAASLSSALRQDNVLQKLYSL